MGRPRKELATGTIDGVNTDFKTAVDYKPGTVVAFMNGQARPGHSIELGGKDFRLEFAPRVDDEVAVYYQSI